MGLGILYDLLVSSRIQGENKLSGQLCTKTRKIFLLETLYSRVHNLNKANYYSQNTFKLFNKYLL